MAATEDERVPSVVASHVDIVYKVFGTGRGTADQEDVNPLKKILQRGTAQIGAREIHAVRDVSFVAYRGESVGLIGRNGSGKSTLLRSVAGLVAPTRGTVWLNGKASLLGVNAALLPKLSGRRNVYIGAQALGLSPRQVRERFDEIVDFAGIGEFIELPMQSYSSGMAARLRFAISTAVVPDILVVDEALATGDAEFKEKAEARIQEIRQEAGTVFMVSHSAAQIRSMCTRGLWLDKGHLIMDGPAEEVADAYQKKYGGSKAKAGGGKGGSKPGAAKPAGSKPSGAEAPTTTTPTTTASTTTASTTTAAGPTAGTPKNPGATAAATGGSGS